MNLHDLFEDKDTFLVKLPNKFKDYLEDPDPSVAPKAFRLDKQDALLGFIYAEQDPGNPEVDDLFSKQKYTMRLDLPRKR